MYDFWPQQNGDNVFSLKYRSCLTFKLLKPMGRESLKAEQFPRDRSLDLWRKS